MLEERPHRAPPLDHRAGHRAGTTEYEILAWGDVYALEWRRNRRRSGNFPTDQNLVAARDVALICRIHRQCRPEGPLLSQSLRPVLTGELTPEPGNPCLGGLHLFRVGGARGETRDLSSFTSVNGPGRHRLGDTVFSILPDDGRPFPYAPLGHDSTAHVGIAAREIRDHLRRRRSEEQEGRVDRIREGAAENELAPIDRLLRVLQMRAPVWRAFHGVIGNDVVEK